MEYGIGTISKVIKELVKESRFAIPLTVQYWISDLYVSQFRELMIDDNVDPQQSYTCFESQIVDKAVQMVMSLSNVWEQKRKYRYWISNESIIKDTTDK